MTPCLLTLVMVILLLWVKLDSKLDFLNQSIIPSSRFYTQIHTHLLTHIHPHLLFQTLVTTYTHMYIQR